MSRASKNLLSILLAIALAFSLVPAQSLAEAAEEAMSEDPAAQTTTDKAPAADKGAVAGDAGLAPMAEEGADTELPVAEELSPEGEADLETTEAPAGEEGDVAETPELSTQFVGQLHNPRIVANSTMKSGQVVTWDCVWLGSYPQTEVPETDALRDADWVDNDAVVGGVRYRRITGSDVTYTFNWPNWTLDHDKYHYFRYEPIKWRILEVSGRTALAVADVALDCRQYHKEMTDVTWATSTIRSWLNGTGTVPYYTLGAQSGRTAQAFSTVAFTAEQYDAVLQSHLVNANSLLYNTPGGAETFDSVFLLSESDVLGSSATAHGFVSDPKTLDEARRCEKTDYAYLMGVVSFWLLRSPGGYARAVASVTPEGSVAGSEGTTPEAVRPAMYLDLSSSQLSWAGTVSSDGTVDTSAKPGSVSPFPDVPTDSWCSGVVYRATTLKLMGGYDNGNFGPDDPITRGQVAVVLWNMAGKPAAGSGAKSFPDVKSGDYFYNAVRWASSRGVVSGYSNGKFGPNDKVTREQFAVMLGNYAKGVAGKSVTGSVSDFNSMKDRDKVSSWAVPSVGWCFHNNILSGSNGNVMPQGNATRGQGTKMVVYLHDLVS